ncbi:MAG: hypothetical protein RJA99_603 [Pseudomonadota bacterium]|jgi:hypothetical protein
MCLRLRAIAPVRPHRQAGQVLIAALGLLLAGGLLLHAMFGTGQVVAAKQRLVDTADAAAWSAALWRARVLNYHAYSNRAIVANEVAIAQATTLAAWSGYFERLARNAAEVGALLPYVGAALEGVADAATLARESAELAAQLEIAARGAEGVGYRAILQASQEILQLSTQGFGASMVAAEIARANDRSFFAWVLPDAQGGWSGFTRRADSDADRRRFADLVVASLDPFTAGPRSGDLGVSVPCVPLPVLRKRGATTLSDDLQRWEAVDTLSVHVSRPRGLRCRDGEVLPVGWGAAEAGTPGPDLPRTVGDLNDNPEANRLAAASVTRVPTYSGLASPRELDYERLGGARAPTAPLAVLARQPGEAVATSMARGLASGRMLPPDAFAGDGAPRLWALAAAEVYFRRPVDAPARVEYASLFNPYWQVRLTAPTAAQRATALGYVR